MLTALLSLHAAIHKRTGQITRRGNIKQNRDRGLQHGWKGGDPSNRVHTAQQASHEVMQLLIQDDCKREAAIKEIKEVVNGHRPPTGTSTHLQALSNHRAMSAGLRSQHCARITGRTAH